MNKGPVKLNKGRVDVRLPKPQGGERRPKAKRFSTLNF